MIGLNSHQKEGLLQGLQEYMLKFSPHNINRDHETIRDYLGVHLELDELGLEEMPTKPFQRVTHKPLVQRIDGVVDEYLIQLALSSANSNGVEISFDETENRLISTLRDYDEGDFHRSVLRHIDEVQSYFALFGEHKIIDGQKDRIVRAPLLVVPFPLAEVVDGPKIEDQIEVYVMDNTQIDNYDVREQS